MDSSKWRFMPEWFNWLNVTIALPLFAACFLLVYVLFIDRYITSQSDWVLEWEPNGYNCGDYDVWHRESDGHAWHKAKSGAIVFGNAREGCLAHVKDTYLNYEFRLVSPSAVHLYDLRPSDRRLASR